MPQQTIPHRPTKCTHPRLIYESSPHALEAGFTRPTLAQRAAATTIQGTTKATQNKTSPQHHLTHTSTTTFPAPLILPGDDLALDPKYPPQSRRAWIREKERNKITEERKTIYVAAPPEISQDVKFLEQWCQPRVRTSSSSDKARATEPDIQDIISYIRATYHGLPVKLATNPRFGNWEEEKEEDGNDPANKKNSKRKGKKNTPGSRIPPFISLGTASEQTRIRLRATPQGDFPYQLNLDDILDGAISCLPDDAYALMLLVHQDLYEDDDDEFVCGRAYGGSRVAVISTARYRPELDEQQKVEREHAWPASHCERYMNESCGIQHSRREAEIKKRAKQAGTSSQPISLSSSSESEPESEPTLQTTPIQAAVKSHTDLQTSPSTTAAMLSGLWLSRICRTASHELGHCFGLDHCVYYACSMQGSASIVEDARQPPYLCPVDLSKVLQATGAEEKEHYGALLDFCARYSHVHLFAAYGAWIRARLAEI